MQISDETLMMKQKTQNDFSAEKQAQIRAVMDQARQVANELQQKRVVDRDSLLKPYTL